MPRTVIIDGDIVIYKAAEAVANEYTVELEEDDNFIYQTVKWGNKERGKDYVTSFISEIIKNCRADKGVIALSDKDSNFRKNINPDYKSNRKRVKPALYGYLRNILPSLGYRVYQKPSLEADDVIGILATHPALIQGDRVVWSLDKDFNTVPCKFHRGGVKGEDVSRIITNEEADWRFMFQTLTGDMVDGYKGCPKVADFKAKKLLGEIGEHTLAEMWDIVKSAYEKAGLDEEKALLNARMARILRAEDYDFKRGEPILWKPQT